MDNDPKFYNKDGSLNAYSFACGYIQRAAWDNGVFSPRWGDIRVDLSAANMSISLWDIKVDIGDHYTWLQREGLKNARKCWAQAKAIAKKAATGKISREEACRQIDMLGFEKC